MAEPIIIGSVPFIFGAENPAPIVCLPADLHDVQVRTCFRQDGFAKAFVRCRSGGIEQYYLCRTGNGCELDRWPIRSVLRSKVAPLRKFIPSGRKLALAESEVRA